MHILAEFFVRAIVFQRYKGIEFVGITRLWLGAKMGDQGDDGGSKAISNQCGVGYWSSLGELGIFG